MKKSKAKRVTFRQRMRAQSDERLSAMIVAMREAGQRICKESKTEINPYDVMRLSCSNQTKSLRYRVVTDLANEHEAELERIYNSQQELPLKAEESSGGDVS